MEKKCKCDGLTEVGEELHDRPRSAVTIYYFCHKHGPYSIKTSHYGGEKEFELWVPNSRNPSHREAYRWVKNQRVAEAKKELNKHKNVEYRNGFGWYQCDNGYGGYDPENAVFLGRNAVEAWEYMSEGMEAE